MPDDPETAWGAQAIGDTVIDHPADGRPCATTLFVIDASGPAEAELRLLAWINHSYEDDIRQATAIAERPAGPHRWHVSLRIPGEF
ncbi:hypothetical protein [Streptomyces sp. NPDC094468]|uniref:hypothetical protein n=1 Tax=Streptomyces sp. NPDC094468 TaxID=3366066 RepID=UPI0037F84C37